MSLTAPVSTNGQLRLTLNGEAGVAYVLQSSSDFRHWTPVITNNDPSITRVFTLVAPDHVTFYRSSRAPLPLFACAFAARYSINCNGSGLVADSFDSADPNLSTNGRYDPAKAGANGHVASLFGPVNLGNHQIEGDLYLGPTVMGAFSGSQVMGTIHSDFNACFADVVPPDFQTATPGPVRNVTIDGTTYDYAFLGPTNEYTLTTSASALYVAPNANVRLRVATSSFNVGLIRVAGLTTQAGKLAIYQLSGNAMLGDTVVDSGNAASIAYFGSAGVTSIALGTTNFTGTIYAPSASLTFNTGGLGFSFVGSCVMKTLSMNGNSLCFHFDENLLRAGPVR